MAITTSDRMVMLWRGATGRCPRCESGGLFRRWTEMVDECPRCGLDFESEEGYWIGAIIINTLLFEGIVASLMVLVIVVTWPHIPTTLLVSIGVPLAIILPIVFYPFSKTIWVAIDLSFLHPLRPWRKRRREPHE